MTTPLRYPDPDEAAARLDAWHRVKDRESEPLRAEAARRIAAAEAEPEDVRRERMAAIYARLGRQERR